MANKFVWSGATRTTNGGFAADTDWTKGTGWAISGGLATKTAGSASDLEQNQTVTNTVTYQTTFTVSGRTAGTVFIRLAGTAGTSRSTNATFTENIVAGAGADPKLEIVADSTFDGSVDNVGVFANTGASWEDAYTSLMLDWGAEGTFTPATDFVYVRSVHSETSGTALTITGSTAEGTIAACRVICVVGDTTGTTPGNLATGASVTTTSTAEVRVIESLYIYGCSFLSAASASAIAIGYFGADSSITLDNCRLEMTGAGLIALGTSGSSVGSHVVLKDCVLDFADASSGILSGSDTVIWTGGSVEFDVTSLIVEPAANARGTLKVSGVDFSILSSSSLVNGGTPVYNGKIIIFSRCILATGATIVSGTIDVPGFRVESYLCQIGTDADPSYQMEIQDSRGKVSADTSRYRTGGASDGVRSTPICWDFNTSVGSVRGYPGHALEGPPISAWTAGNGSTAHVYRVAFASDATINDDEIWIELEGPNDAATNSLAALKTTRVAPRTTAAAYTTDTGATWTGSGVTTKQYMQITYTPDKPGPVTVRVMMAKASDNIYIDPKIQIDPA